MPDYVVIHTRGATARPGSLQVVNTATHRVVRTLGSSYAQTGRGFQVTGAEKTIYYEQLDTKGTSNQIVAQPLGGGPARTVADGSGFSLSANGKLMAVTAWTDAAGGTAPASPTVRIVNPQTGSVVASTRLPVQGTGVRTAWVAGKAQLFVLAGVPLEEYLLDVHGHRIAVSKVPPSSSRPLGGIGWTTVWPLGPGPTAGTILATARGPLETLVVRATDGNVLRHYPVPWPLGDHGVDVRGADAGGRRILVTATSPTPTTRLWEWTPPSPRLRLVGPTDIEASW